MARVVDGFSAERSQNQLFLSLPASQASAKTMVPLKILDAPSVKSIGLSAITTVQGKESTAQHLSFAGNQVEVSGILDSNGVLTVPAVDLASRGVTGLTGPTAAASPTGSKKVLVVLGRFADADLKCGAAQVNNTFFGAGDSVRTRYETMSSGNLTVRGKVVGPFTIAGSRNDDGFGYYRNGRAVSYVYADLLRGAAIAAGERPADYDIEFFVVPSRLGWAGLAELEGRLAWGFEACDSVHIPTHELGHIFGLHHASFGGIEYGDDTCAMGNRHDGLFNALNRMKLGFIPQSSIREISQTTTLDISRTAAESNALGIPQLVSVFGHYFSWRAGEVPALGAARDQALSIHTLESAKWPHTYLQASIKPGEVWQAALGGISVRTVSGASNRATIEVRVDGGSPYPAPTLTFTADRASVPRGQAVVLTWKTTGADSVSLPQFGINALPPNLSGRISIAQSMSITAVAQGPGGKTSQSVNIEVAEPEVPQCSFSFVDSSVSVGGSAIAQIRSNVFGTTRFIATRMLPDGTSAFVNEPGPTLSASFPGGGVYVRYTGAPASTEYRAFQVFDATGQELCTSNTAKIEIADPNNGCELRLNGESGQVRDYAPGENSAWEVTGLPGPGPYAYYWYGTKNNTVDLNGLISEPSYFDGLFPEGSEGTYTRYVVVYDGGREVCNTRNHPSGVLQVTIR